MQIAQLKTFLIAAETGSITGAALSLDLAQSTVTARIQGLERELGTALFYRAGRQIQLTSPGRELIRHAQKILGAIDEATSSLARLESDRSRRIRLLFTQVPAAVDLPQVLASIRDDDFLRQIAVEVSVSSSKRILRALLLGEADIGVVNFRFSHPAVACQIVNEGPLLLVKSASRIEKENGTSTRSYDNASDDSLRHLYYVQEELEDNIRVQEFCRRVNLAPANVFGVQDVKVVKELVRSGLGTALLPRRLVADELASGEFLQALAETAQDMPHQVTSIIYRPTHERNSASDLQRRLVALIKTHYRSEQQT